MHRYYVFGWVLTLSACLSYSQQLDDGQILFSAADAKIAATAELSAGTIIFGGPGSAAWNYKPTRWGTYEVQVAAEGAGLSRMVVEVAGLSFPASSPERVYLATTEPFNGNN